jgi:hypothetical protein
MYMDYYVICDNISKYDKKLNYLRRSK